MVQSNATTQLPIVQLKDRTLMHGSIAAFKENIFAQLKEVELNELEMALLNTHLDTPTDCAQKVTDLLTKVKQRVISDSRKVKYLSRVIPLFAYHDFWSH